MLKFRIDRRISSVSLCHRVQNFGPAIRKRTTACSVNCGSIANKDLLQESKYLRILAELRFLKVSRP